MSPTEAISFLDGQLALYGESITLKRGADTVTVKALVRGKSSSVMAGTTGQMHWTIVLSPTGLGSFGTPKMQDDVVIKGKECQISCADPVHMNGTLVRVNLDAAG